MEWVYRQADHTIIYLGDGTPETSLFLEALRSKSPVEWKSSSLDPDGIENGRDALDSQVEVAAREWVLAQPWFKRVWILQELVLSHDPWIQCGTSVARWSSLDNHISDIAKERSLKPEEKIVQDMGKVRLERRRWESLKDIDSFQPFAESLYNLLKSRKGFGVTDPRDMLFANLGVIGQRRGPFSPRSIWTLSRSTIKKLRLRFISTWLVSS